MKTIVTHISPDEDAISSIWLIRKFLSGWSEAILKFVPAGSTLDDLPPDQNPDIIHVDTGLGKFDHHQSNENTCAAKKVYEYLKKQECIKEKYIIPLERMTDILRDIDHFREVFLPDADNDRYDFSLTGIINGLKLIHADDDKNLVETGEALLDGILQTFVNKIHSEQEVEKGLIFNCKWGKSLAVNSETDLSHLAHKKGYSLVIRKNPKKGHVKITLTPKAKGLNLSSLYTLLKEKDQKATWFFHSSGNLLLNGSTKNPTMKPTRFNLPELTALVKNI